MVVKVAFFKLGKHGGLPEKWHLWKDSGKSTPLYNFIHSVFFPLFFSPFLFLTNFFCFLIIYSCSYKIFFPFLKRITLVIHIVKIWIIESWSPPWLEPHPSSVPVYCVSFQTFISTHFLPYLYTCLYPFIHPSSLVFSSVILIMYVPCSCYTAYIVSWFPFIYFYILNINIHE